MYTCALIVIIIIVISSDPSSYIDPAKIIIQPLIELDFVLLSKLSISSLFHYDVSFLRGYGYLNTYRRITHK